MATVTETCDRTLVWKISTASIKNSRRMRKSFVFRAFDNIDVECFATCVVEKKFCSFTPRLVKHQTFTFDLTRIGQDADSPLELTFKVKLGRKEFRKLVSEQKLSFRQTRSIEDVVTLTRTKTVRMVMKLKTSRPAVGTSLVAFASPWLNEKALSDVTVVCGDRSFDCHKIILAGRSEFFHKMLTGEFKEAKENAVHISVFEPDVVEMLIRYVYTEDVPEQAISWELFEAATMYGVTGLRDRCLKSLRERISVDSCTRMLEVASVHDLEDVFEVALRFFKRNKKKVIKTEGWERVLANTALLRKIVEKI